MGISKTPNVDYRGKSRKDFTMKKYVTFTWLSCNCGGTETCLEEEFEEKKKFFKAVFGAYRFEIIHN